MAKHHTKDKGDNGVGKVISDLMDKGLKVAIPICEHLPFDLIAINDQMQLAKIQVKYKKVSRNKSIEINLRSCYSDKNGSHAKCVDKDKIDAYAVYCPNTNEVYYISTKELSEVKTNFNLSFGTKGKRFANDYLTCDKLFASVAQLDRATAF